MIHASEPGVGVVITDIDSSKSEVECPECHNTIELDWNHEDGDSCGGDCGGCGCCGHDEDDSEDNEEQNEDEDARRKGRVARRAGAEAVRAV